MAIRYTIDGGIALPDPIDTGRGVRVVHTAETVRIPLRAYGGTACEPQVRRGDRVLRGQCIGLPTAEGGLARFSSVSGTVESVERGQGADGTPITLVTVRSDGKQEGVTPRPFSGKLKDAPPAQLIEFMRDAGLVSRGEPLYLRLQNRDPACDRLAVNCVDSQPGKALMRYLCENAADQVVNGVKILLLTTGISQAVIAINRQFGAAADALADAVGDSRLIRLAEVGSRYPQEDDVSVISAVGGVTVGRAYREQNKVWLTVGGDECAAVYRAFAHGMPDTERTVAVNGDAVREPGFVRCPIGTSFGDLIRACGGLVGEAEIAVTGGLMNGLPVSEDGFTDDDTVSLTVMKRTARPTGIRSRIAAYFGQEDGDAVRNCIRCGDCARVCPDALMPHLMLDAAQSGKYRPFDRESLSRCRLCGACAYVCPSRIPLRQIFAEEKRRKGEKPRD